MVTTTETFVMIQGACKEEAMSLVMVFIWHKKFKDGCEDVEDNDRAWRPSTSRTDENLVIVRELLNSDRYFSVRLKDRVCVRPDIKDDWVLHHDNALSHMSLAAGKVLIQFNIATLPQSPYSPDLAPRD